MVKLRGNKPGSLDFARDDSIRLAQHWIGERALAVARLVVVPVIDFQIALQFQMTPVGGGPFAKQITQNAFTVAELTPTESGKEFFEDINRHHLEPPLSFRVKSRNLSP